jgi:hypothetical protein
MTVERMTSGETPSVAGAQAVTTNSDSIAIAPSGWRERVVMPEAKAALTPGFPIP